MGYIANNKLTKAALTITKALTKTPVLVKPKSGGHDQTNFRKGAPPPLSTSFRRYCLYTKIRLGTACFSVKLHIMQQSEVS